LTGENRTLKFLRYAVGEIILVVVDILIALQINNANENNKTEQKELILLMHIAAKPERRSCRCTEEFERKPETDSRK